MTFAYYASPHAVQGLQRLHEKGERVSKNALKKLDGIIIPPFYNKVAAEMRDERTTLQPLQKSIDTIIIEHWVMMHLDHPQNIQYVRPEKGVCIANKACVVFPHGCVSASPFVFLSHRHAHPRRSCSTREASIEGDSWYMGQLAGT